MSAPTATPAAPNTLQDHFDREVPDLDLTPQELEQLAVVLGRPVDLSTAKKDAVGMNSNVFIFESAEGSSYVLKQPTNPYSEASVMREAANLARLVAGDKDNTLPYAVPHIIGAVGKLSVMTLLPGLNGTRALAACESLAEREQLMHEFGSVLRKIHNLQVAGAPLMHFTEDGAWTGGADEPSRSWFVRCMELFAPRVRANADLPENVTRPYAIRVAAALKDNLDLMDSLPPTDPLWTTPPFDKIEFCHGDFMLPNVLFARADDGNWRCSGILDWGDAGYADGRHDIMAALGSIEQNAEENFKAETPAFGKAFLTGYGLPDFDEEKWGKPWDRLYDIWDFSLE
ncbi:hypothetical protein HDU87_001023 [Geranomyces variabilis]|uniref:Aminoglycoside phosphotransferase domain-containing protein n=1 Tax=Geranomyces variabilis TaxID=109894 RepID=A0AAD5TQ22_9FUNG|nr:hypothetical protein HDU87_001023 [Geranomyces variabilis]